MKEDVQMFKNVLSKVVADPGSSFSGNFMLLKTITVYMQKHNSVDYRALNCPAVEFCNHLAKAVLKFCSEVLYKGATY